jgi:hypothetical protein
VVEAVLHCFEGSSHFEAKEEEEVAITDDVAALELGGDGFGAGAGGDVDEGFGRGAVGEVDKPSSDRNGDEQKQQKGCEKLQTRLRFSGVGRAIFRGCRRGFGRSCQVLCSHFTAD